MDLENNRKLRQKLTEEIDCLSNIRELKDKVGNLDVNSLILEKKENREKSELLVQEVILFLTILRSYHFRI